jgi:hypothetical protein
MLAGPMRSRMARLEEGYEQLSARLTNIDPRFDAIDRRFDAVDRRFDAVDRKIDLMRDTLDKKINALDKKIEQNFMWMIGIVLTAGLTSTGATITAIYLNH